MATVISQIVNFGILVAIIWYFAGGAIKNHFVTQKEEFLKGMESAALSVSQAEKRKSEIESRLIQLRNNADSDIEEAQSKAEETYRSQLANAKNEAMKMESDTQIALEAETQKAIEALRVETFEKSAEFAEQKMDKELTPNQLQAWNSSFPKRLKGVH